MDITCDYCGTLITGDPVVHSPTGQVFCKLTHLQQAIYGVNSNQGGFQNRRLRLFQLLDEMAAVEACRVWVHRIREIFK